MLKDTKLPLQELYIEVLGEIINSDKTSSLQGYISSITIIIYTQQKSNLDSVLFMYIVRVIHSSRLDVNQVNFSSNRLPLALLCTGVEGVHVASLIVGLLTLISGRSLPIKLPCGIVGLFGLTTCS